MKKIISLLTALFLTMTIFIGSEKAEANMDLLSELVKKEGENYCGVYARSMEETEAIEELPEGEIVEELPEEEIVEELPEEEVNLEDGASFGASPWKTQTRKTDKGSKIVMSAAKTRNYGYCHIFYYHLKKANGDTKYETTVDGEWKSQFKYAYYPKNTMDIALEVLNGTDELVKDPKTANRYYKEFFSYEEGQRVRVVLQKGSTWAGYNDYDWVIVSMYPVF